MHEDRRQLWLRVALIFAVVALCYGPVYHAGFIWDDDDYVTQNPVLRTLGGLFRIWFEPTSIPQYYPLVHSTFWIEYQLWGLAPLGYHVVNVLLHATGASLLLVLLQRLRVPGALFAALVFAAHPVHVESVAWITERKNVLSGVFYLAALGAWDRWRPFDGSTGRGGRAGYWKVTLLFACALFSKTVTCSLPAAILLLIWWRKGRIERRDVAPTLPLFVLGAAMAAATVWLEREHVEAVGASWDYSMVERVVIAGRALWFYAGKLVWPTSLTFSYPKWEVDAAAPLAWLPVLAAAALVAALWALRNRVGRGPLIAALFFGGTLLPALGFFDVFPMRYSFVADHFQYLASLGPIVLLCGLATRVVSRRPVAVRVAGAAAVVVVLGVLTWRQCRVYEGHLTLWTDTVAKNPTSGLGHTNLGKLYVDSGDYARAIEHLRAALALDDTLWEAHANLGVALLNTGDVDGARAEFERVIELEPDQPAGYNNLGVTLARRGDREGAIEQFRKALAVDPRNAEVRAALAMTLAQLGREEDALRQLDAALRLAPGHVPTLLTAADLLLLIGRAPKSAEAAVAALRLAPGDPRAIPRLAWALRDATAAQSEEETVRLAEEACRPIPGARRAVLESLAAELAKAGRPAAAAAVRARIE